jgi:hypothetical protein
MYYGMELEAPLRRAKVFPFQWVLRLKEGEEGKDEKVFMRGDWENTEKLAIASLKRKLEDAILRSDLL